MTKPSKVLGGVVAIVLIAAIAGVVWFVSRDNPDEASLEGALAGRTTTSAPTRDPAGDTDASADDAIAGTWSVQTGGAFDFDSAEGTFAGFRIKEELVGIGAAEAVGRTGDVSGTMTIEGNRVTEARFEVNLTTIRSNESRRERRIQEALETAQFPAATFELTEPIELADGAASGKPLKAVAKGDLTIHGVTQPVEFPLDAQLSGDTVAAAGSLDITFADFGVEVPSAPVVVSAEDHGLVELQLLLSRG